MVFCFGQQLQLNENNRKNTRPGFKYCYAIHNRPLNKELKLPFPRSPSQTTPSPHMDPSGGQASRPPMVLTYFCNGLLHSNLIVHSHD